MRSHQTLWMLSGLVAASLFALEGCHPERIDHGGADGGASGEPDAGPSAAPDAGGGDAGSDGGTFDSGVPDAGQPDAGEPDAGQGWDGGAIHVWARGDTTLPANLPAADSGIGWQTPSAEQFALARFDLMQGPADPSPVRAFDHGNAPVVVDLLSLSRTLAGVARTAGLPAGTYTYGRVALAWVKTTVDATANTGVVPVPGKLTVTAALSDTVVDGVAWKKGQAVYAFSSQGLTFSFSGAAPPLPSTPGGSVVQDSQRTWLVFAFTSPYVIDPTDAGQYSTTITYDVGASFRWQELVLPGFAAGRFDLDAAGTSAEPVLSFGATGYRTAVP